MKHLHFVSAGLAAAVALVLSGCGDGLSKGALAKVIDEHELKSNLPVCWSVERLPAQLPLTVGLMQPPARDPILGALGRAGYVTFEIGRRGMFGGAEWTFALTDAGRKARVWDENKGFCIGRRRVQEVLRWTEPAQERGATYTLVSYRWKLADSPDWVKPGMFPGVKGSAEPVEETLPLVKTSDGWRVPG